jgi:hypothetical protein
MWTRKSDIEIKNILAQKELQNKSLTRPVVIGSVCGLLFMTAVYFGLRGGTRGFYVFTHQNGFNLRTLLAGGFGFILFFGLSFYHQRKGSSLLSENKCLRCEACKELSPVEIKDVCQCGGKLEPSEYYTWEEAEIQN